MRDAYECYCPACLNWSGSSQWSLHRYDWTKTDALPDHPKARLGAHECPVCFTRHADLPQDRLVASERIARDVAQARARLARQLTAEVQRHWMEYRLGHPLPDGWVRHCTHNEEEIYEGILLGGDKQRAIVGIRQFLEIRFDTHSECAKRLHNDCLSYGAVKIPEVDLNRRWRLLAIEAVRPREILFKFQEVATDD
jgi:hypothetical protein